MNKLINFSEHAEERMDFRNIDKEIVIQIIYHPDQKIPDCDNNNREICQSLIKDNNGKFKLIRIVIEETKNEILVISVYLTSKIKKYWRE